MSRPRVLLNHPPLHPVLGELLEPYVDLVVAADPGPAALLAAGREAVAVVARGPGRLSGELLSQLDTVRGVVAYGSGTDAVDLEEATSLGVAVLSNAGIAPGPVAEYVIGSILALLKKLPVADNYVRGFGPWAQRVEVLRGREAGGRTLGLIGFGHIGRDVARRARLGLDMTVIASDPAQPAAMFEEHRVEPVGLDELLLRSDVVSVHIPLLPSTRGLLGTTAFAQMRPGAVLINAARGGIVDEDALCAALQSGHLSGAAVDVFDDEPMQPDNPLLGAPNVLLSPHVAGITEEAVERLSRATAANVLGLLRGDRLHALANPECWPADRGARLGWPLARGDRRGFEI